MRTRSEPRGIETAALPPFHPTPTFSADRLVLGSGTVLLFLDRRSSHLVTLDARRAHDRMVALLAVAARGELAKASLLQIDAAAADWRRGDKGLAAIRLAFAPLPRLHDRADAYRIALADRALSLGLSPGELMAELGYIARLAPLLKAYDPDQPRVPAGQGVSSGQWTSGAASSGTRATPPAIRVASTAITPVFLPTDSGDGLDQDLKVKEREFGIGPHSFEDQLEEGRPSILKPPVPGIIGPTQTPSAPSSTAPQPGAGTPTSAAPATGAAPVPLPSPLGPRGGGTTPFSDQDQREDGLACPAQRDDVSRGRSPSGDEFEYLMSLLINPESPTPKYSAATPTITSQAYFLPSPTPAGETSFDDCKQRDTPTVLPIPALRPGDMFEDKAAGWGWLLSNSGTYGYAQFKQQVENQNAAVVAEGRGRQIYYCFGDQAAAYLATTLYGNRFRNSHFLVCH